MRGLKMKRPSARRGVSGKAIVLVDKVNNTTGFEKEEVPASSFAYSGWYKCIDCQEKLHGSKMHSANWCKGCYGNKVDTDTHHEKVLAAEGRKSWN